MTSLNESVVEQAALAWLESLGYAIVPGPEVAPGEPQAEREDYGQVVLERRLQQALQRLNPQVPADAIDEAFRKLTRPDSPSLVTNNHIVHKYLVEGVPVQYQRADGSMAGDLVRILDYDDLDGNEFLAVNQFTVVEDQHERRPDVVLFVNGLPLAVIELKNAATESVTVWTAFNQLQTYKQQIPSLFVFNEALVVSDGVQARIGTLTADREWFLPWRTIEGEELADTRLPQLQMMLHPAMENPTLVIITDRNDLDDQLYGTFARCHEVLRQQPVQALRRVHLRDLLNTGSGGVVFTTGHKFFSH